MFIIARAVSYSTLFISLFLILLPQRILGASGIVRPAALGLAGVAGIIVATLGAAIAVWCILTFATIGQGTPAPFDPPRRLVVRGPYRFVRNPMYLGAMLALCGAAMVYRSSDLLGYVIGFGSIMQVLVVYNEEPTLLRQFGADYNAYLSRVPRWLPHS
jgi:protein-S-isoprenylcysteine O-methyltransferase Ste14